MLESLLMILVVALVLLVVYFAVGKFIQGAPLQVIGMILGLVLLIYALKELNVLSALSG